MAIKNKPKNIPNLPGVYFFKASGGKILYIGKAANLSARLSSYFAKNQTSLKTTALMKEAESLFWKTVNGEAEALIREAELIKKYRPKYNVLMRDDKQYFYVGFSKEKYPKIFITHQINHGSNYIGPFTEGGVLRSVLKTLRRAFPYCTCKKPHTRPCLNARIGRCLGFCCLEKLPKAQVLQDLAQSRHGGTSRAIRQQADMRVLAKSGAEEIENIKLYNKNISFIRKILSGKNKSLAREFKKEMRRLSDTRKYEEAGKIRDQIRALEKIFEHRGVIKRDLLTEAAKALRSLESILGIDNINRIEAYDIANIQGKFAYGSMAVFMEGKPQKDAYRIFKIKNVKGSNDVAMLREVIFRRLKHPEWPYPQVILIDGGKPQLNAALKALNIADGNSRWGRAAAQYNSDIGAVGLKNFQTQYSRLKLIAITKNKKHIGDHIFIAGKYSSISLDKLPSPLKNLILHLDSEAHRFAISHYRKLHRKQMLT